MATIFIKNNNFHFLPSKISFHLTPPIGSTCI
jgi:hypothetical protein